MNPNDHAAYIKGQMSGKEAFIGKLAARLGRTSPLAVPPARPVIGAPEGYKAIEWSAEEKRAGFIEQWGLLSGQTLVVKETEAEQAIYEWLSAIMREDQLERVVMWDHEQLQSIQLEKKLSDAGCDVLLWNERSDEQLAAEEGARQTSSSEDDVESNWRKRGALLRKAERCQIGVVCPQLAIANTGTLVLHSYGTYGRSVSLLPTHLFAIVHEDQLVTRMGEAFAAFQDTFPETAAMPSSLNLITGPSRSADIENDLTIGIHGPGKVYCVIITAS